MNLEWYWNTIPIGKENSASYDDLCALWNVEKRAARSMLHRLSAFDNGDDYVLIRTSRGAGFYRTNDKDQIALYRRECLNRGRNTFAPLKKIDRVLNANSHQYSFTNNLRVVREEKGMTQSDVCELAIRKGYIGLDEATLAKTENGVECPDPALILCLCLLYDKKPEELICIDYTYMAAQKAYETLYSLN